MDKNQHYRKLENMYHGHPLNTVFKARLTIQERKTELLITVNPELFHAANAVHGAVYFKALDDAAFFAANSIVFDVFVLTTAFTTYLTRPVSSGELRSIGQLVSQNRSQYIAEAVLYNNGVEVGRGTGMYVRSKMLLSEVEGYSF
ncbi:MAG: PaaI family thioesterase [Candidatus Heimdallarchaeota archaeon]